MSLSTPSENATRFKLWNNYITSPESAALSNISALFGGVVIAAFVLTTLRGVRAQCSEGVPFKRGIPFIGSWSFFTHRYEFIEDGLRRLGSKFRFSILNHRVLVVSGEEARKVFFGHRDLSMVEGYKVLFGGVPEIDDIGIEREHEASDMNWFGRRITNVLRRDRLAVMIPLLLDDVDRAMSDWSKTGQFDTFDKIYNIVFQLSIRAGSCNEIANSPELVARVTRLYWDCEKGSTATSVLLPWLPNKARKLRNDATRELYELVKGFVDDRKKTGRREVDTMQILMDEGDGANDIVQFILSTLFAGIINTGIMSSWMLLYLHMAPEWKAKATQEVQSFIAQYTSNSSGNLIEKLAQIPPQVWDDSMPVLDLCLRETIRVVASGTMLRRVMNDEGVTVDGVKAEKGTFLAYHTSEAHFSEAVFSEPERWDPGRFERGEDKKEQWSFLGWGVGRHPCLGMRFAKLEVKIILALFLTRFEYSLVDAKGEKLEKLPEPYRDNLYQVPPSAPVYVKYKRVGA